MRLVSQSFTLFGFCPSKKSSRMWTRKRLITNPNYQLMLAPLLLQARNHWHGGLPVTNAEVGLTFFVSHLNQDLDGASASVMDLLKIAGVIVDDSMRYVRRLLLTYSVVQPGNEGVRVEISGVEAGRKVA
jgi:hypothetical protein